MKKSIFSLIFILSTMHIGFGQIVIPTKFKKIKFPELGSNEWYFLNGSNLEYSVKNINSKLEVSINHDYSDFKFSLVDGKLIGTSYPGDAETFYFQPTNTTKNKIEIKKANVMFVFKLKGQLYFIESIENDFYRNGFLYKLNNVGNNFTYTKVLEIGDTPLAFLLQKDILYIATDKNFVSINNLKLTTIFKDTIWKSLYPNSIAYFSDKSIFVGLRAGIAKLDLKSKSIEYYQSEDN